MSKGTLLVKAYLQIVRFEVPNSTPTSVKPGEALQTALWGRGIVGSWLKHAVSPQKCQSHAVNSILKWLHLFWACLYSIKNALE